MFFTSRYNIRYFFQPLSLYILIGLALVNFIALSPFNPFYIGSFLSFAYIISSPGILALALVVRKKFEPMLGVAISVALSIFALMIVGLCVNTVLPHFGNTEPLRTLPLLYTFNLVVIILFSLNFIFQSGNPIRTPRLSAFDFGLICVATLMPILAGVGSIILNNNGSNILTLISLTLVIPFVPVILLKHKIHPSVAPVTLFMTALAFLLMNSLRGSYITGHDILLEFNVFQRTNIHHIWKMSFYQDAYNACLSLTILPTFLQQLIHVPSPYIFKFFTQFIGALPVVMTFYLIKNFTTEKIAYLGGFLYVTFPTFMVDMAFLNRQGIAFLFYSALIYVMMQSDYFGKKMRVIIMFILGTGMILSHYSTSYVAIPVLIAAYGINYILRFSIKIKHPNFIRLLINKLPNLHIYSQPVLIPIIFVIGLTSVMFIWSNTITKTSDNIQRTLIAVVETLKHPLDMMGYSGPAKYSITETKQATPEMLLNSYLNKALESRKIYNNESDYYPQEEIEKYPATAVPEFISSLTYFGKIIESRFLLNLKDFYIFNKQLYAKVMQVLLLIGFTALMLGYHFRGSLTQHVPVEYIALSIAGIGTMVAQTVLPGSAIDYGLLRLFQQNLIFLVLPIMLGFIMITSFLTRNHRIQLIIAGSVLLFFFVTLSGLASQITGGGRPMLSLNNNGLYYSSYYMHAEEVYAMKWLGDNTNPSVALQAARFSDIKMRAYGQIQPRIELLPKTARKNAYVYLNFENTRTQTVIEMVNGDVLYYYFPTMFFDEYKNRIYDNGGSRAYR